MSAEMVCPTCKSGSLQSVETASVGYSIQVSLDEYGDPELNYTGGSYEVFDDGTQFENDIWCRACGWSGTLADLVTA